MSSLCTAASETHTPLMSFNSVFGFLTFVFKGPLGLRCTHRRRFCIELGRWSCGSCRRGYAFASWTSGGHGWLGWWECLSRQGLSYQDFNFESASLIQGGKLGAANFSYSISFEISPNSSVHAHPTSSTLSASRTELINLFTTLSTRTKR